MKVFFDLNLHCNPSSCSAYAYEQLALNIFSDAAFYRYEFRLPGLMIAHADQDRFGH